MAQVAAQHIDRRRSSEQAKQGEAAKIAGRQAKTEREMAAIQSKAGIAADAAGRD